MNLQVKWTLVALQSLSDVLEYTYEQFGERQLRKINKRINSSVLRIMFFPNIGKPEPYVSELIGVDFRSVVVKFVHFQKRVLTNKPLVTFPVIIAVFRLVPFFIGVIV